MGEYQTQLRIEQLYAEIRGGGIKTAARQKGDTRSWTRRRDMPLEDILTCALAKKGLSAAMELRHYFQAAGNVEHAVSKQNYLKQRRKLNPEVFRLLNRNYLKRFYDGPEAKTWRGYLVMAADGSRAEIPNSEENRRVYGESVNKYGKTEARANISALHDTLNRFVLDVGIHHYRDGEIAEAKANIAALKEIAGGRPALVIFDRNYASLEFMDFLEKAGVFYLIRLHSTNYQAEVGRMRGDDEEVEILHSRIRMAHIRRSMPERERELAERRSTAVRIVRSVFDNGERGILATNLREGSAAEIRRLYRRRWSIEKKYHALKNKLKFESVTGKASIYVAQDFFAQLLVFNMVQDLITGAERRAAKKAKKKRLKYEVRINENIAIGLFKEQFIRLILEEDDRLKDEIFRRLIADMERNIVPVRKLKSAPRRWKYYNKYKCNLKPSF